MVQIWCFSSGAVYFNIIWEVAIRKGKSGSREKEPRKNREIDAREIRVVDEDGNMLGLMSNQEAISLARERNLDLVEISPMARPPVCKIIDYGKLKYQKKKKAAESKKKQTSFAVKEVQFSPRTQDHDVEYKVKHIYRFLAEGDKAKVTITFRGREMAFKDQGYQLMDKIFNLLDGKAVIELAPKMEGRKMTMVLIAAKGAVFHAKDEVEERSEKEI